MEFTLHDLLESGLLPDYRILGKKYNYTRVPVHNVSVQELPVDPSLISEGELILSTAAGCLQDENRMMELILQISRSLAAAVIFSFPDDQFGFPEKALNYAAEVELPLFVIPWSVKFRDVVQTVSFRIQKSRLSGFTELQTALFNSYFQLGTLENAAGIIREKLGTDTIITNPAGLLLARADDGPAEEVSGAAGEAAQEASNNALPEDSFSDDLLHLQNWRYPIRIAQVLSGYLVLGENFDPEIVSQYICFPLSLWFSRQSMEDMMRSRLKNDFVRALSTGDYSSFAEMLRQAALLGFNLEEPSACILMRALPVSSYSAGGPLPDADSSAAALANEIEALIEAKTNSKLLYGVSTSRLEFIIYLPLNKTDAGRQVSEWLQHLQSDLSSLVPSCSFHFGISEISLKKPDFRQLYSHASIALHNSIKLSAAGNTGTAFYYFTYMDVREAQIVSILHENGELRREAGERIGVLSGYGRNEQKDKGIDLVGTLSVFLHSNYNIAQTARELHIHRQSLLYRLEKIEELTEMSLSSHQDLFLLEIWLRVLSMYE